jgi:NADH-quinone oxidoreductase subunit M
MDSCRIRNLSGDSDDDMILVWFVLILLAGGVMAWIAGGRNASAARWISLLALCLDFVLGLLLWIGNFDRIRLINPTSWIAEVRWDWIPQFGVRFHLAMDGLSLLMVLLTFFLGIVSVLCSWTEIREGIGFFHFNLMWILAGIIGVFLAVDLFLFYFAWELMLVPMYFLIAIWGHERRIYAAVKFFLFTQLSGLLMLISILALFFIHHDNTGVYTFEYSALLGTAMAPRTAAWIMFGFFIAFAVKLPMFPFHPWLPDAHTEAPTAGSVILAGLLLKTGAYGMLRFVVPLFPDAAHNLAPLAMLLGIIGILYGAVLAFAQTDLKRMVSYTSVSHLGFVLLGIFAWDALALEGAVITMICHGISTGALFVIVGVLQERMQTREIDRMGGLWTTMPILSGAGLYFAVASIGLPGLGNFVGEFLILLGTYRISIGMAVAAAIGIVVATTYGLKLVQRAFHGANTHSWKLPDLHVREMIVMAMMIVLLLFLGLYPQPALDTFKPAMDGLQQRVIKSIRVSVPGGIAADESRPISSRR